MCKGTNGKTSQNDGFDDEKNDDFEMMELPDEKKEATMLLTNLIRKCLITLAYGVAVVKEDVGDFIEYLKTDSIAQEEGEVKGKTMKKYHVVNF